jgi:hypothetical protein
MIQPADKCNPERESCQTGSMLERALNAPPRFSRRRFLATSGFTGLAVVISVQPRLLHAGTDDLSPSSGKADYTDTWKGKKRTLFSFPESEKDALVRELAGNLSASLKLTGTVTKDLMQRVKTFLQGIPNWAFTGWEAFDQIMNNLPETAGLALELLEAEMEKLVVTLKTEVLPGLINQLLANVNIFNGNGVFIDFDASASQYKTTLGGPAMVGPGSVAAADVTYKIAIPFINQAEVGFSLKYNVSLEELFTPAPGIGFDSIAGGSERVVREGDVNQEETVEARFRLDSKIEASFDLGFLTLTTTADNKDTVREKVPIYPSGHEKHPK